jgi:hypothetical protein
VALFTVFFRISHQSNALRVNPIEGTGIAIAKREEKERGEGEGG